MKSLNFLNEGLNLD